MARLPTYHHKGKAAAADYISLAKFYAKLARADDAFNEQRKREGKPAVPAVRNSARVNRARAKKLLEMARKAKAGYVGKYKAPRAMVRCERCQSHHFEGKHTRRRDGKPRVQR